MSFVYPNNNTAYSESAGVRENFIPTVFNFTREHVCELRGNKGRNLLLAPGQRSWRFTPATRYAMIILDLCRNVRLTHAEVRSGGLPCTYWRNWSQLERVRMWPQVRSPPLHDLSHSRRSRNRRSRRVPRNRSRDHQRTRRRRWREEGSAVVTV